jgi:predicted signal transduction protein with EAL and GGDEF domain
MGRTRQEEIRKQATHDLLTGLPNRFLLHDRLTQVIARLDRSKSIGSILYLDLDDFKNVNDEFSHDIGDQALISRLFKKISALDVKLPILTGIISIATEMGLDVITEGVETETQLNFLKNAGCYRVQGRYFKKSFEKHGLLRLLAQQ